MLNFLSIVISKNLVWHSFVSKRYIMVYASAAYHSHLWASTGVPWRILSYICFLFSCMSSQSFVFWLFSLLKLNYFWMLYYFNLLVSNLFICICVCSVNKNVYHVCFPQALREKNTSKILVPDFQVVVHHFYTGNITQVPMLHWHLCFGPQPFSRWGSVYHFNRGWSLWGDALKGISSIKICCRLIYSHAKVQENGMICKD